MLFRSLYNTFFLVNKGHYTVEEIEAAVIKMNKIAPLYFKLNNFFRAIAALAPDAQKFLDQNAELPADFALNAETLKILSTVTTNALGLVGKQFEEFAVKNVHTHAEYNWFVMKPLLEFANGLNEKTALSCEAPGLGFEKPEEVLCFGPEKGAIKSFIEKIKAQIPAKAAHLDSIFGGAPQEATEEEGMDLIH